VKDNTRWRWWIHRSVSKTSQTQINSNLKKEKKHEEKCVYCRSSRALGWNWSLGTVRRFCNKRAGEAVDYGMKIDNFSSGRYAHSAVGPQFT